MRATKYYHADNYNSLLYFSDPDEVDYYFDVIAEDDDAELAEARSVWKSQNRASYSVLERDPNDPFANLYSRSFDEPVA